MGRTFVRTLFVVLVVAVLATSASAEDVDEQDLIAAPAASPKVATMAPPAATVPIVPAVQGAGTKLGEAQAPTTIAGDSGLDMLRKQNEEALATIQGLKNTMAEHEDAAKAQQELEAQQRSKQADRDEAEQDMKVQEEYMKNMNAKMATADDATQIMKQIMDISNASREKVSELREKLKKATGKEAVTQAATAEEAQSQSVDDAHKRVTELNKKLTKLVACRDCPNKDDEIADLQTKLRSAEKSLTTQQAAGKAIESSAKASVDRAAAAKVRKMQEEMKAAKEKLLTLEKEAEEAASQAASAGQGPVKLVSSKDTAIAEAAVHEENQQELAKQKESKDQEKAAEDALVHMVERRTKKMDEAAEADATSTAEGETHKVTEKVQERIEQLKNKLAGQKVVAEKDAKKLKAIALQAAAEGNIVKLSKAQANTAKALSAVSKTQHELNMDEAALGSAKDAGIFGVMHAKAVAAKKVTDEMSAGKERAEKHTTPELEQMKAAAQNAMDKTDDEITDAHAKLKKMIVTAKDHIVSALDVSTAETEDAKKAEKSELEHKEEATLKGETDASEEQEEVDEFHNDMTDLDNMVDGVKAENARQQSVVSDIAKNAGVAGNDVAGIASAMVSQVGKTLSELSSQISSDSALTQAQVSKLNAQKSTLKNHKKNMMDLITHVKKVEGDELEAKKAQKDAELGLSFREAIEVVEKKKEKSKENAKKVAATQVLMTKIEQKMAAATADSWKQRMHAKIGGPSVTELEKQESEIQSKIAFAKQKAANKDKVVSKMEEANVMEDNAKAAHEKLIDELKKAQEEADKAVGAAKRHALLKVEELSKKEIAAAASIETAKADVESADSISPALDAAQKSIDKFKNHLDTLANQKSKLSAVMGMKEASMKRDKNDPAKLKKSTDALVETKEQLQKNFADFHAIERRLERARVERAKIQGELDNANDAMAKEKDEKVDAKNSWVKNMVNYAQKEQGMKKYGTDEQEKHTKGLIAKNQEKEAGHKKESSGKQEKTEKAEEIKDKAFKREEMVDKEKAKKAKEKETKQEEADKEKTNKEGIAGELKNKQAAEVKYKADQHAELTEKAKLAVRQEEANSKALQRMHDMLAVATENKGKKEIEFKNAKQAETSGRTSSESTQKAEVKAINDEINAATGAQESSLKANKASKVEAARVKEQDAKDQLVKETKEAEDVQAAAMKEFVDGQELKDKASQKESATKAEETALTQELDEKAIQEKNSKESATKAKEVSTKKEGQTKVEKEALNKLSSKTGRSFVEAQDKFKRADAVFVNVQKRYQDNEQKYEKFEKARASSAQGEAIKELSKAQSELVKDEKLFKDSKTPQEERIFGDQVKDDRNILKVKQVAANRDEQLVDREMAEKKENAQEELTAVNTLSRAETAYQSAHKAEEKITKQLKGLKKEEEKFDQQIIGAEDTKEKADKAQEAAQAARGRASNEESFKSARNEEKMAKGAVAESEAKLAEVKDKVDVEGKKAKDATSEATVKEKGAKFDVEKANQGIKGAVINRNGEIKRKQTTRSAQASKRHLDNKQALDLHVETFQKANEKALKGIQSAANEKDFKKMVWSEKKEKEEYQSAKVDREVTGKHGDNELERKKDDKDLFTQLMEKEEKRRAYQQKADEAADKSGEVAIRKMRILKEERESEEVVNKAMEKLGKVAHAVPGEQNATIPEPSPTPAPSDLDNTPEEIKEEKPLPEDNPQVKDASNFTSVYKNLEDQELEGTMRRRRSWHRRRRWVARRRAPGMEDDGSKKRPGGAAKEAKPGFSASFWHSVSGVSKIADGIMKLGAKPPDMKEIVDSIAYEHTAGYWMGLNDKFINNFFARFRGHINVPTNGTYTFFCNSDDGSIVYINGIKVCDNDGVKDEMTEAKGDIKLEPGVADVVIDYFAGMGKTGLIVEWKGPGMDRTKLSEQNVHAPKYHTMALAQMSQESTEATEVAELGQSSGASVLALDDTMWD